MTTTKAKSDTLSPEKAEAQLREAVEEAHTEANAAEAEAHRLREALESGEDLSITAARIRKASEQAEYLRSKAQGTEARAKAEEMERVNEAASQLYSEMVDTGKDTLGKVVTKLADLGEAVAAATEAIKQHNSEKGMFRARWLDIRPSTVPMGQNEKLPPSMLRFLSGERAGGGWGAVGGLTIPDLRAVELILAVVGETLSGSSKPGALRESELVEIRRLTQGPTAGALRRVREAERHLKEKT